VTGKGKGMPESSYDKVYFEKLIHRSRFQLWMRSFFFSPLRPYLKGNVLDVGCGIGEIANYVEAQENYFGLDINPYCVEYLQDKGLWAKAGSVYQIPLDTASMDVIILSHVLEHLEEPDRALTEISRVLKPSGTFIVIVPMHHGYTTDETHRIFYRPRQLADLAQKHKYDVKSISIFPIPWEFLGELFYFFEYRMIAQKHILDESREE
jgi:ubiquinone/menaquinone biosynthesis C-methylase UbiE